jgi:regulator of sigma E protease
MEFIKTIFYFIVTVGILVLVHEFGHFIAAKLSGMRVDIFSIGFGTRLFGRRIGETDYRISLFPLGGYVKIAGMIDESMDTGFVSRHPMPFEFRAKPFHQKFLVITAGVTMNLILAVMIFWGIFLYEGKNLRVVNEIGYVEPNSVAYRAGIRSGDKILSINGKKIKYWEDILGITYLDDASRDLNFEIERGGEFISIHIPREEISKVPEEGLGIIPRYVEVMIIAVEPGRPADGIGLRPKDVILEVDGKSIYTVSQLVQVISSNAGREISIRWRRGDEILSSMVTPDEDGKIGIQITSRYSGPMEHFSYGILEAFLLGVRETYRITSATVVGIWQLISGQISIQKGIAGPIKIAKIATQSADVGFIPFLTFMAILSISLALLNILPVPGLDGGHLAILIIEGIIRRELSYKVKIAIQQVGIILLLILMALVIYNDIVHF